MSRKRAHFELDPDYEDVSDQQNKRQRVLEEGGILNPYPAKEATKSKIETIIRKQFGQEIENKEAEIVKISEALERSRTVLDRLRACIVASYYGNASQQKCSQTKASQQVPMIHPTVKKYLGKAPKGIPLEENSLSQESSASLKTSGQPAKVKVTGIQETEKIGSMSLDSSSVMTVPKVPVSNSQHVAMPTKEDTDQSDTRAGRFKVKKRIIVGNVSKTIPADRRDENDQATHKWMVYVRGPKDSPRIDHFVKKVWFFLHPSYRPNDLVEVSEHPFHLTRRGWGEFPVRVQLHFKDSRNKRLDIIHNIKLDRTYTSLQTLGAETVVDIELERDVTELKKKTTKHTMATGEATITNSTLAVKQEPLDYDLNLNCNSSIAQSPVCVEFDPGGHAYVNRSVKNKQIPEIKLEPMDHDYGVSAHTKPIATSHYIKQEGKGAPNFVIPGANNNLRLVFSGVGSQGVANVISSQVNQNSGVGNFSPVKTGFIQQTSPKSQKKGQAVLQMGNTLTLQGVGSLSNSGIIVPNQAGKQNMVPVLLGNSPTKVLGNQPVLQSGSILLSPALPVNTPVSGNQTNIQSGSVISPTLPLNQPGPGNQTNNPGLIFLKCTDNQGKTYLIPQQVCPNVQTSKETVKRISPPSRKTATMNSNTHSGTSNKLPVNVSSSSQVKVSMSSPVVNLSQLTAVGLQPKQTPVQLAGPLIFIKPEDVPKLGSHSKSSPPNAIVDAKPLQSGQTVRLFSPPKSLTGINANSSDSKVSVNQSSIRGQLKVTSQGLITVQNNDKSFNKNLVIKTEPTDDISVHTGKDAKASATTSVAKQPIIILPQNNKVPVSLQCKSTSLHSSAVKVPPTSTLSNFIIVNASKDSSAQKLESNCLTNTTPSCEIKSSSSVESGSSGQSGPPKANMLLLQTKTAGSDKPNHLVIVPVSCGSNTVTRPTISIATMSSSGKSLVVSKSLTTVCSTIATSTATSVSISANDSTLGDKNKTMYIVVDGNANKERSSGVSEGQRSMTSLLNNVSVPVCTGSVLTGVNNGKPSNVKTVLAQSLLKSKSSVSSSSTSSLSSSSTSLSSSSSLSSSLLSATTSLSSSVPSLSSLYSLSNTIPVTISTSGQKETKVLVVNSNNHVTGKKKPWKSDEKKIISLGPKTKKKVVKEPEKTIKDLGPVDDYPDLLSLIRAAVNRHPVVRENTAKYLHPYCAASNESWLDWNVGKRRASEWQRASSVRKFILSYLDGKENFKGEPLWSVKQILTWCRLHAYSPHYMEKQLHPTGLNLQSESSLATDKNNKFKSLTGYSDVIQEVVATQNPLGHHDDRDDDVDIIAIDPPKVKVKAEIKDVTENPFIEYLPMSDSARFVQDTAKKIGVKFSPTEVEPGYHGHLSQDYIFSAMESFVGDILRETFALQVNMGRYPDALGVADVYRALSNLPITDFVTNKHFGVENTRGVPTAYR